MSGAKHSRQPKSYVADGVSSPQRVIRAFNYDDNHVAHGTLPTLSPYGVDQMYHAPTDEQYNPPHKLILQVVEYMGSEDSIEVSTSRSLFKSYTLYISY